MTTLTFNLSHRNPDTDLLESNPTPAPPAGVLFQDDFTSYPLDSQMTTAGNADFGWKDDQSTFTHVRAFGRPGGSSRSVEFAYGPSNDCSLGFLFAANQTHAWFRYYLYYPSGSDGYPAWVRTNTTGANNNKFLRLSDGTVWNDPNTFRFGGSTYGNADGSERFGLEVGGPGYYNSPGGSSSWPMANLNNNAIGAWVKIEEEVKMNTTTPVGDGDGGHGIADGIYRMWRNDILIQDFTNVGMAPAGTPFRQGYLLGAANMQPDNANSKVFMTDFAVSLTGRV